MAYPIGKYEKVRKKQMQAPVVLVPLAFFLLELFAFCYLQPGADAGMKYWPLAFGAFWSVLLGAVMTMLPRQGGRVAFGLFYGAGLVYTVGQTGYYLLFSEMMWLSEFRYASEGADYLDVILSYPLGWFVWVIGLLALGVGLVWKYPRHRYPAASRVTGSILAAAAVMGLLSLPQQVFEHDSNIRYAKSDYGRMQSAEAAWENMFNPHRLYQICGVYQTVARDISMNILYPLTPGWQQAQELRREQIDTYFHARPSRQDNAMTGLLKDKHVVLVLMESMDDWMIGEHTPTIARLMAEGINFTNFYTPPYGGIRTFNTEFCINTGSFLSSQGGYAFDYVTNAFSQSLASVLTGEGYCAKTFHYNDPSFYSRDVFSEAMGYEDYVYYADYLTEYSEKERKQKLYDELVLFSDPELRQEFFRDREKTLNFVITRSAHLSYKYNEVLSHWALKRYPEYKGLTGNEETDCALLKARLVDDFFSALLIELEREGKLENTVIIGVTDHYTYGYKDETSLLELSGVGEKLLLEKTPCFIWSSDLEPMEVSKTLNTADFLPTVLNLLGVKTAYNYMGHDAFDDRYEGYALFSDGSWIAGDAAYDAGTKKMIYRAENAAPAAKKFREQMSDRVEEFVAINNLILDTDYYKE